MSEVEYLPYRYCMCPQINDSNPICPGIPDTLHKYDTSCRFVKVYQDERGWRYFVRSGISMTTFKAFYVKPGKSVGGHGYKNLPWKDTFDKAQADLNMLAEAKSWVAIDIDETQVGA